MTTKSRSDEYQFIAILTSAMRRSEDRRALGILWADYREKVAGLSPEGQEELKRLRAARERELKG